VENVDRFEAPLHQRHHYRPGGAAGPDYHRRSRMIVPAGRLLVEIGGKAIKVGIVPPQHDRFSGCGGAEGVDRTDGGGPWVEVVAESCGRLLERDGDVATHELSLPQALDERRQGVRSDV